jgi:hypothetical protein
LSQVCGAHFEEYSILLGNLRQNIFLHAKKRRSLLCQCIKGDEKRFYNIAPRVKLRMGKGGWTDINVFDLVS